MLDKKLLLSYVSHPELLGVDDVPLLAKAVEESPYSHILRMLYLKALHNSSDFSFDAQLARSAAYIPDRSALFELINAVDGVEELSPQENAPAVEDDPKELGQWISEQDGALGDVDAIIDRFIKTNPRIKPVSESLVSTQDNNDSVRPVAVMTETLARIYAEQGKFDQAMEAFRILILQNPNKADYFSQHIDLIRQKMK